MTLDDNSFWLGFWLLVAVVILGVAAIQTYQQVKDKENDTQVELKKRAGK